MTNPERRVLDWTEIDAAMHRAHELRAEAFQNAFAIAWRWIKGNDDETAKISTEARPCPSC